MATVLEDMIEQSGAVESNGVVRITRVFTIEGLNDANGNNNPDPTQVFRALSVPGLPANGDPYPGADAPNILVRERRVEPLDDGTFRVVVSYGPAPGTDTSDPPSPTLQPVQVGGGATLQTQQTSYDGNGNEVQITYDDGQNSRLQIPIAEVLQPTFTLTGSRLEASNPFPRAIDYAGSVNSVALSAAGRTMEPYTLLLTRISWANTGNEQAGWQTQYEVAYNRDRWVKTLFWTDSDGRIPEDVTAPPSRFTPGSAGNGSVVALFYPDLDWGAAEPLRCGAVVMPLSDGTPDKIDNWVVGEPIAASKLNQQVSALNQLLAATGGARQVFPPGAALGGVRLARCIEYTPDAMNFIGGFVTEIGGTDVVGYNGPGDGIELLTFRFPIVDTLPDCRPLVPLNDEEASVVPVLLVEEQWYVGIGFIGTCA